MWRVYEEESAKDFSSQLCRFVFPSSSLYAREGDIPFFASCPTATAAVGGFLPRASLDEGVHRETHARKKVSNEKNRPARLEKIKPFVLR